MLTLEQMILKERIYVSEEDIIGMAPIQSMAVQWVSDCKRYEPIGQFSNCIIYRKDKFICQNMEK